MFDDFKILVEIQIAYRKAYQTSDHLFTLLSIIQKVCNQNNSGLLCFFDFKQAFDSVVYTP